MREITLTIKNDMDLMRLLTGINYLRDNLMKKTSLFASLPEKLHPKGFVDEAIEDHDALNTLAAQLCGLIEKK